MASERTFFERAGANIELRPNSEEKYVDVVEKGDLVTVLDDRKKSYPFDWDWKLEAGLKLAISTDVSSANGSR